MCGVCTCGVCSFCEYGVFGMFAYVRNASAHVLKEDMGWLVLSLIAFFLRDRFSH